MAFSGQNGEWRVCSCECQLPIVGWAIWYADGTVRHSSEILWELAPDHGVQAVTFVHPDGRTTIADGFDAYHHPDHERAKFGQEIDFARYSEILAAARAWRPPTI